MAVEICLALRAEGIQHPEVEVGVEAGEELFLEVVVGWHVGVVAVVGADRLAGDQVPSSQEGHQLTPPQNKLLRPDASPEEAPSHCSPRCSPGKHLPARRTVDGRIRTRCSTQHPGHSPDQDTRPRGRCPLDPP